MKNERKTRGGVKASQVRGNLEFFVRDLAPVHFSPGIDWHVDPRASVSLGTQVDVSGVITYAPFMVPRLRGLRLFRVVVNVDVFDEHTRWKMAVRYMDSDESPRELYTGELGPHLGMDRFTFDVPLERVRPLTWFSAALAVDLLSPLEGAEKREAEGEGRERPMHPVLVRGAWLEMRG